MSFFLLSGVLFSGEKSCYNHNTEQIPNKEDTAMAEDLEILHFLTTEPFSEMLQTYTRLKPLSTGP